MKINGEMVFSRTEYIEARCKALSNFISKIPNVETVHYSSTCAGCSNYIDVFVYDENEEIINSFQVKISDHWKSGHSDLNYDVNSILYHGNWSELKKECVTDVKNKIAKVKYDI